MDGAANNGNLCSLDGCERIFVERVEEARQLVPVPPDFDKSKTVDAEGEENGNPDDPVEGSNAEEVPLRCNPAPELL